MKQEVTNKVTAKKLHFESDDEREDFEASLMSNEVIQTFIESAFNGNVLLLPPIDKDKAQKRFKQAHYISNLNTNRPEIMKKIHKVSYAEIFSDTFDP